MTQFAACFVGSELVDWLVTVELSPSRADAVKAIRGMCRYGLVAHVTNDHDFEDAYFFYRFYWDSLSVTASFEKVHLMTLNISYFKKQ